jgi:hypothetical protein
MPRGRKPKSKQYFTQETEDAINAYNKSTDYSERDRIFSQHIYKPFYKIAEVVYNKYKISYMGDSIDAMMDCVVWMLDQIAKFKGEKGKAFSYFTIIARNYYFQNATANYKEIKRELYIDSWGDDGMDLEEDNSDTDNKKLNSNFISKVIPYLQDNMHEIMTSELNIMIGHLSLEYFYDMDKIEDFNRKFFQADIAKRLGLDTKYTDSRWKKIITDAHNRLNIYYYNAKKHYLETGQMPEFRKSNQVSAEIIKYILDNYEPRCSRVNGILAMSKKLNIEENIIRNILNYEEKYRQMYHLT